MNLHGFSTETDISDLTCGEKVKEAWATVPLFVRFFIFISTIFFILSFIPPILFVIEALANIPANTFGHYYFWSLLTCSFINLSIINFIFGFFAWIPDAIISERLNGTLRYMFFFFLHSFFIQIIFLLFAFLIGLVWAQSRQFPSAGIWPLVLAELNIQCMGNPDPKARMKLFLIPIPIPNKFLPWLLFLFFSLINGFRTFQIDILSAILYGYFYHFVLRNRLTFSNECLSKCQDGLFKCLTTFTCKHSIFYIFRLHYSTGSYYWRIRTCD